MLRTLIKKNLRIINQKDIYELIDVLNTLSPWPWTPKFVTEISKTNDLEFTARSPELVEKLCKWILHLYGKLEAITFTINIPLCGNCTFWEGDPELQYDGIIYGKCKETQNVIDFSRSGGKTFLTPNNFGCINGKDKEKTNDTN
jgi:hypothetical protein